MEQNNIEIRFRLTQDEYNQLVCAIGEIAKNTGVLKSAHGYAKELLLETISTK